MMSMSDALDAKVAARRQAEMVAGLRRLVRSARGNGDRRQAANRRSTAAADGELRPLRQAGSTPTTATCCTWSIGGILCTCESCLALRGGDAELRPTGTRTVWLETSSSPTRSGPRSTSRSASRSSSTRAPRAASSPSTRARPARPSPSSPPEAWRDLRTANPVLMSLESDAEALIVNRIADPPQYAIAPIDECYRLVGLIKVELGRDLGRRGPERAIAAFFAELRERAAGESGRA